MFQSSVSEESYHAVTATVIFCTFCLFTTIVCPRSLQISREPMFYAIRLMFSSNSKSSQNLILWGIKPFSIFTSIPCAAEPVMFKIFIFLFSSTSSPARFGIGSHLNPGSFPRGVGFLKITDT